MNAFQIKNLKEEMRKISKANPCTIYLALVKGNTCKFVEAHKTDLATAMVHDGYTIDYWMLNGKESI